MKNNMLCWILKAHIQIWDIFGNWKPFKNAEFNFFLFHLKSFFRFHRKTNKGNKQLQYTYCPILKK